MERVQRKLRRLLAVSGLIMVAGLVAVFAAIFYRLSVADKAMPMAASDLQVALPAGAELLSATATGDRLTLVTRGADGGTEIRVVDLSTGRPVSTVTLTTDAD